MVGQRERVKYVRVPEWKYLQEKRWRDIATRKEVETRGRMDRHNKAEGIRHADGRIKERPVAGDK